MSTTRRLQARQPGNQSSRASLRRDATQCDDVRVESLFEILDDKWWLVFPALAFAGHWANSWRKASDRRHQRKVELYKLKNRAREVEKASAAEVESLMAAHDAANKRWLDYELDVGKLVDFPLMTDVREPLTVAFLRAKREADGLRPAAAQDMTSRARRELDGLIVLPDMTVAALEKSIAPMLDPGARPSNFHHA